MTGKFSKSAKSGKKSLSGKSGKQAAKGSSIKSTGKSSKSGKIKVTATATAKSTGGKSGKLKPKTIALKSGGAFKSLNSSGKGGKTISGKSGGVKTKAVPTGFPSKVTTGSAPIKSGLPLENPKRIAALLPVPETAKEVVNPIASSMGSKFFGVPREDDHGESASKFKFPTNSCDNNRHSQSTTPGPTSPEKNHSIRADSESCSFSTTRLPSSDAQPKSTTPSKDLPPPVSLSQFRVPSHVPAEPPSASLQSLDTGNSLSSPDASSGSSIDTTTNSQHLNNGK